MMRQSLVWTFLCFVPSALLLGGTGAAADLAGVAIKFEKYDGPATVGAQLVDRHQLRLDVDPKTEREPLAIRVELPGTGRNAWPVAGVEVRDARGRALAVRRSGIEWQNLLNGRVAAVRLASARRNRAVHQPVARRRDLAGTRRRWSGRSPERENLTGIWGERKMGDRDAGKKGASRMGLSCRLPSPVFIFLSSHLSVSFFPARCFCLGRLSLRRTGSAGISDCVGSIRPASCRGWSPLR